MTKREYIFWITFLKQRVIEAMNENYKYRCKESMSENYKYRCEEMDAELKDIFLGTPLSIELYKRRKYELFRKQS